MSEDFINISRSLDTLTLAQVAEKINVKNIETAKKWLKEKGIKVHRFLTNSFVYQIEVDSQIDKPFAQQLRNKYPDKWKDRYRDVVKDLSVYHLTITLLEDEISPIPRVKSSRINKKDEIRYKKLLG
jgi:deoxyribodipyrimidine photolyase